MGCWVRPRPVCTGPEADGWCRTTRGGTAPLDLWLSGGMEHVGSTAVIALPAKPLLDMRAGVVVRQGDVLLVGGDLAGAASLKARRRVACMADADALHRWDEHVAEVGGWRGDVLTTVRRVVLGAVPGMVEEWKWAKPTNPGGVPVWSCNGGVCTGEVYKSAVKLTFYKGASLEDTAGLFTSSLDGKVRRAVDIKQGQVVNEPALADLVRAAVALNMKA